MRNSRRLARSQSAESTSSLWTRKWVRRTAAFTTGISIVAGGSLAYAAWTATATGGKGAGQAGTITVQASSTAPTFGSGQTVHPGSVAGGTSAAGTLGGDLYLTVTNNNGYPLYIDTIQQAGLVSASGGTGGTCSSDSGTFPSSVTMGSDAFVGTLTSGSPTYASYTLPAQSVQVPSSATAQTIQIPNVLGMTSSSPNVCQGAALTVPVTVTLGTS